MESNRNLIDFKQLNGQQIYSLIHEIIDNICGIYRLNQSKYVPNNWSTEQEFNHFVDYFNKLLPNLIDIRGKHEVLQQFSDEIQKILLECIEVRRAELRKAIINNTIADNNPVLKDFFWKLNVVLESDRMTDVNEALIGLDLKITERNEHKDVSIELNREELSQVLKTLESAQQELRQSYG